MCLYVFMFICVRVHMCEFSYLKIPHPSVENFRCQALSSILFWEFLVAYPCKCQTSWPSSSEKCSCFHIPTHHGQRSLWGDRCVYTLPWSPWGDRCVCTLPWSLWGDRCVCTLPWSQWKDRCTLSHGHAKRTDVHSSMVTVRGQMWAGKHNQ